MTETILWPILLFRSIKTFCFRREGNVGLFREVFFSVVPHHSFRALVLLFSSNKNRQFSSSCFRARVLFSWMSFCKFFVNSDLVTAFGFHFLDTSSSTSTIVIRITCTESCTFTVSKASVYGYWVCYLIVHKIQKTFVS